MEASEHILKLIDTLKYERKEHLKRSAQIEYHLKELSKQFKIDINLDQSEAFTKPEQIDTPTKCPRCGFCLTCE